MTRRAAAALLCALAALCFDAPLAAAPILVEDRTIPAVDERAIRFYINRPDRVEKVLLLLVVDGSGCIGQRRPSSWGNYAPAPDDPFPYARLMVEKPGVEPEAADLRATCTEEFHRHYTIQNRVLDHLRVLQHLERHASWWNGELYVWGWSDGGDIAGQLVIYRPSIRRAVLGAMGGGLTMAEQFERFWACPPETTADRAACLADLRGDFARITANPSGELKWNGESHATWVSRLRTRLTAPLADNQVPVLIVHGERDRDNTPVEAARELVAGLRRAGNEAFTYWEIAGMKHGWNDLPAERQRAIHRAMLDWLLTGVVDPARERLARSGSPH